MSANVAFVDGIGIWSEQLPGWELARDILRGAARTPGTPQKRPSPSLLPTNERRRAPDTVAISMEVASKACEDAGRDPASLPCVFTSTHGDLAITDYMCETLAQSPELISPTKFHNSVHNAAAGYWAIATKCVQPYTALSAGACSFGNGLLEALVQLHSEEKDILFVAYDIEAKGALSTIVESTGRLGLALVLSPSKGKRSKFSLRWEVSNTGRVNDGGGRYASESHNAMASGLELFSLLARSGGATSCSLGQKLALDLSVEALSEGK